MAEKPLDSDPGSQVCPPLIPKRTPEELSADAWDRIAEAMQLKRVFPPHGPPFEVSPETYMKTAQWLATLKSKRPKAVMRIEDHQLKETK